MHFSWYFQQKFILSGCWRCENWGNHSFPYRSLLLSTTVLNDIGFYKHLLNMHVLGRMILVNEEFIANMHSLKVRM